MRKSLTWAAVGTTIAAAVLSAAGTASAATTAAKAPTTLLIGAAKHSIYLGGTDTISGVLKSEGKPLAGKWVKLFAVSKNHLVDVGIRAKETGRAGGVSFVVAPKVTTTYELVFSGTAADAASHSVQEKVTVVKPLPSTLTATVAPSKSTAKVDVITGTLKVGTKDVTNRWVYEYKQLTGKNGQKYWKGVVGKETGSAGTVSFAVPVTTTATTYELVFLGGDVLAPSHSAPVTIG